MKEKRKKIVARVGAMVAVVLLVALCALPAFADEMQTAEANELTNEEVIEGIIETYGLGDFDPVSMLLRDELYTPNIAPYIFKFRLPNVGEVAWEREPEYLTSSYTPEYEGHVYIYDTLDGHIVSFEHAWMKTSHTTSGTNKFVYFDIMQGNERVQRLRLKIDKNTGELISSEFDGLIDGSAEYYIVGAVLTSEDADVVFYGLGKGYLKLVDDVSVDFYQFKRAMGVWYDKGNQDGYANGLEIGYDNGQYDGYNQGWLDGNSLAKDNWLDGYDEGYQIGKNEGYDDGMSQSSLIDGVTAIFRAPMELINSVLNFEILGINMAVAVRVLVSMAILGVVITVIWKAVK